MSSCVECDRRRWRRVVMTDDERFGMLEEWACHGCGARVGLVETDHGADTWVECWSTRLDGDLFLACSECRDRGVAR